MKTRLDVQEEEDEVELRPAGGRLSWREKGLSADEKKSSQWTRMWFAREVECRLASSATIRPRGYNGPNYKPAYEY